MKVMEGLTIREIAERLGIDPLAAKQRLLRAKIQPKDHAGKTNIYDEAAVEAIRNVQMGRPKKATEPEKPSKNGKK